VCGAKFGEHQELNPRNDAEKHIVREHYGSGAKPIPKDGGRKIEYH